MTGYNTPAPLPRIWYHYRRETRLREDAENRTLRACSRFIFLWNGSTDLPDKAHENAIWGLHEDQIEGAESIRRQVAEGEKLYLLKITSPPEHDLYVADTSVFEAVRTIPNAPKEMSTPAYDAYWRSLIPFDHYKPGMYKEPEVVCFTPVPFACVELAAEIEDYIKPRPAFDQQAWDRLFPAPD